MLQIAIAPSEPLSKKIHLSKISIQSPELELRRDHKGALNVSSLFPEEKEPKPKPAPQKTEPSTPLSLEVDEIQLGGGKFSFSDISRSKPFKTVFATASAAVPKKNPGSVLLWVAVFPCATFEFADTVLASENDAESAPTLAVMV